MNLAAPPHRCRQQTYGSPLSASLLLLSWILPQSSFAQVTSGLNIPSSRDFSSIRDPTALSTSTLRPDLVSFTTSSITSLPPIQTPTPPTSPPVVFSKPARDRESSFVNLYFLLLFLLAVLGAIIYYFVRRRRREKSARSRNRRHNALVRDLASWPGMNRSRTGGRRGLGNSSGHGDMEEGLDERGEAPPPYEPPPHALSLEGQQWSGRQEQSGAEHETLPVDLLPLRPPMRTLTRESHVQPPGYEDTINNASSARTSTRTSIRRLLSSGA
ncbi:MAG: hypothetical protein M1813_009820 [Trichoglossum hirsutum]|nr:MAG: hypothetical protein M1813_009820 [Trichoglossum hirsutum]